jgi:hypothetical protein
MAQSNRAAKRAKARSQRAAAAGDIPEVVAPLASLAAHVAAAGAAGASSGDADRPSAAALSVEVLESIKDILLALQPVLYVGSAALSHEIAPRTAAARPTPKEVVDELVKSAKPASTASEIDNFRVEIAFHQEAKARVQALPERAHAAHLAACDASIGIAQAQLDKLSRRPPSAQGVASSLATAKASHVQHAQSIRDSAATGAAKATARAQERMLFIDRMFTQLEVTKQAILAEETRVREAHQLRDAQRETELTATLAEFDVRITAATPTGTDHEVPMATDATAAAPAATVKLEATLALVQEQLLQMQKSQEALQVQLVQSQREAAFGVQVDDPPAVTDLPQLDVKNKELMTACGTVFCLLTHWHTVGGRPFTTDQVAKAGCPSVMATAQQLLGNHAARWQNADSGVVPKQVCSLLLQALQALKVKCEKAMEVDSGTAKRCADWAESLSKRKSHIKRPGRL